MGILGRQFWTTVQLRDPACALSALSDSTALLAPLRRCGPPAAGHFARGCCCSAPASAAPAALRPSGGTGELSMIQSGRRPVPAPAWRLRRLRPPPMVIVLRRLEVGAPVKGREALPHGHSVADCPLLRPSRRLPQPGRHDGIGGASASRFSLLLQGWPLLIPR